MPQTRGLGGRSVQEWGVRGLMTALALLVGYDSVRLAAAQTVGAQDKLVSTASYALAHRLAPGDGRITALFASSLAGTDASSERRRRADQLAKEALHQDATVVAAVSTLGLNAQMRGDDIRARQLFVYAERLSRRDLPTQLWGIADAVKRGDVDSALRHYDVVFRINPTVRNTLYPVLVAAGADPAIRKELVRRLAAKPGWADNFIQFAAANSDDPRITADLFAALDNAGISVPEIARSRVIDALIGNGFIDQAWAYYTVNRPNADRHRSRDPRFAARLDAPSLLDWRPLDAGSVSSSIQRNGKFGLLDFSAPASIGGALLQQVQLLSPGIYRLRGHSIGIDQQVDARPYWSLRCQDGHELGRLVLPNSAEANGVFTGLFTVPSACAVQLLVLVAQPSDAADGLSGQIDRVILEPVT